MKPFGIHVVDAATRRGVPLVELRTTSEVRYVTDSAGWIAFDDPAWMGKKLWFSVASHGYELPADGFGFHGVALTPTPGGEATVKLPRVNIAERLYRITGEGIYRDSELLGKPTPVPSAPNGRVMGQDSALAVVYKGKVHWFWGDTNRPEYPLGHFGTAGATSSLADDPDRAIRLRYFVDKSGFSRPLLPMDKPGPVWVSGVVAIENGSKLVAQYMRMKSLAECVERGLALWDDAKARFVPVAPFDPKAPSPLSGHPYVADGYVYGTRDAIAPLPGVRVRATLEAMKNPAAYETLAEKPWTLRDAASGKTVQPHGGSVHYNAHRKRWVMVVGERFGATSNVGEIWYAEAPTALGPWETARKIVTHNRYDFYNVVHHPFLDRGRYLYFEGTYVNTFSGNPETTPRYNYNQILYRLDLDDPRLRASH